MEFLITEEMVIKEGLLQFFVQQQPPFSMEWFYAFFAFNVATRHARAYACVR